MNGAAQVPLHPVWWDAGGLGYIDQRRLPHDVVRVHVPDAETAIDALRTGAVAGAGCAALFLAFAAVVACSAPAAGRGDAVRRLQDANASYAGAANLLERVLAAKPGTELEAALALAGEYREIDRAIVRHAAPLVSAARSVLTHGNSGAFATGGEGTALGAIVSAYRLGGLRDVYIDETQPSASGRRLTAFECAAAGVAYTLVPDTAAAALIRDGAIGGIIVGAESMAANGDVVSELGTYGIAIAAAAHRIPFYVAMRRAQVDLTRARAELPAEPLPWPGAPPRSHEPTAALEPTAGRAVGCLRYDITPGHLVSAVITEYGVLRPPYVESLATLATRPLFALTLRANGE